MANAISSTATFWFLFLFIFCLFFFKGLNSPRWKWWASLLTLCRPLTWLKVEIWWLFLKFPIIWTVFLCVPKQNLASCCGAWQWCFQDCFWTESSQRAPICLWHKLPVMFFPAKPRGVCPGNGSSPHTTTSAQQQAPLLAAGRDMGAHRRKVPGHPCPCCPLCFPLTLCYGSCRLLLWFPGSLKL